MGIVYSSASMSLDGYIAYDDDNPGALFDWYDAGDIEFTTAVENLTFHLAAESDGYVRALTARLGALVVGRRLFDVTDGWNGKHPYDVPVVVVTHERPAGWSYPGSENFHFVTEGITSAVAVARSLAGDLDVSVAAGEMASQALESGLLDEVRVDLVPVILGSGRPYFTGGDTWRLGDPTSRIEAKRVTHLVYPVHR